jgi:hypothetical protein
MARPPNVNFYRSGIKNEHRQVIVWEDEETGEFKTYIFDPNNRRLVTLEEPKEEDGETIRTVE